MAELDRFYNLLPQAFNSIFPESVLIVLICSKIQEELVLVIYVLQNHS